MGVSWETIIRGGNNFREKKGLHEGESSRNFIRFRKVINLKGSETLVTLDRKKI